MDNNETVLKVENLNTFFYTQKGIIKAVKNLSFEVNKQETLAIVGESGCGKSVTSLSIMGLIPSPPGKIESGNIIFEDRNLVKLSEREMRKIRGNKISMIFQEPMTSLNPVYKIGEQITEVLLTHTNITKKLAIEKAIEMLKLVGIPAPEKRIDDYPHQLSGGMRQRVMIAMALSSPNPKVMIADEPTTALDVTIQAQILSLLKDLQEKMHMSIILITHDMGVVAEIADKVIVMYAGYKIEEASVYDIFEKPSHPYTVGLLNSIPSNEKYKLAERLDAIPGTVPNLLELGDNCPFENRCKYSKNICKEKLPELTKISERHNSLCHFAGNLNL